MPTVADALTDWLAYELQSRTGFRYDRSVGRYRDNNTGRLVSERAVMSAANGFREHTKANIRQHTQRFLDGQIELPDWQRRVAREVKDAHIVSHMAGRGGKNAMTQSDWGRVGGRLRFQYQRLDTLAVEVKAGMLSPAQIQARAEMYGNSAKTAFHDGQLAGKQEAGMTEMRRHLQPGESCPDCVEYASREWQPIGSMPPPGVGSVCLNNCNCIVEYR